MKKTVIRERYKAVTAVTMMMLIGTSLTAGSWEKRVNVGVSGNKLEYNSNQDYNWGAQMELESTTEFDSVAGLRMGWNIGFEYYTLGEVKSLNDSAGYNVDGMIIGGYSFDEKFNIPMTLLGGVGYAAGQIGSDYNHGLTYKATALLSLSDSFGVGVQYKHVDLSVVTAIDSFDSGLDIASAYMSFVF